MLRKVLRIPLSSRSPAVPGPNNGDDDEAPHLSHDAGDVVVE